MRVIELGTAIVTKDWYKCISLFKLSANVIFQVPSWLISNSNIKFNPSSERILLIGLIDSLLSVLVIVIEYLSSVILLLNIKVWLILVVRSFGK